MSLIQTTNVCTVIGPSAKLVSQPSQVHTHTHTEEKEEYDATGAKAYLKSCESLGIIPASYFIRTVQAGESSVCMEHHGLGAKGGKAIAVALTVSST